MNDRNAVCTDVIYSDERDNSRVILYDHYTGFSSLSTQYCEKIDRKKMYKIEQSFSWILLEANWI